MTAITITTLADLLDRVQRDRDLPSLRRRDLASDLSCLARLLERDPRALPAELRALRRAIDNLHHAQLGISRKRLQNIRSSLNFVLKRYQVESHQRAHMTADWRSLYESLEGPREQRGLVGFLRYCSAEDLKPADVTDATTAAWRAWLEDQTLRKKPGGLHRQACRIWNEVKDRGVTAPDGRPLPFLTVPDNRAASPALPWAAFSPSFVADVDAYLHWLSGKDLFCEHPPRRACKPGTIDLNRRHIRLLASAAVSQGFTVASLRGLSDLVDPACVRFALEHYLAKTDGSYTNYLRDLTKTLYRVARNWSRDEDKATWIADRLRRMGPDSAGLTPKNRATLRHFDDAQNVDLLLQLPSRLMADADAGRRSPARDAVRAQLAVAIELFLVAPMRLGNLAQLRIDQHVTWAGSGKDRECFISLDEADVKNGVPLEFPIPAPSAALLARYLTDYRPHLAAADCPWLFPGKANAGAGHKLSHTLGQQLKKVIREETGLHLTPHQFRHVAAKLYLDHNPGNYEVVRRLLGHKTLKTTVAFYTGLETRAAVTHYDETLQRLRDAGQLSRHRGRSR